MPLETEIKLAVHIAMLPKFLKSLPRPVAIKELKNEYFDTQDRALGARREMLRLRFSNLYEGAVLCFKGPSRKDGAIFQASEHEWQLTKDEATSFLENPLSYQHELGNLIDSQEIGRLKLIGAMHVRRVCVDLGNDFMIEIDHVRYPDGFEDAEIELEVQPEDLIGARSILDKAIANAGIQVVNQEQTKYARFLAHGGV
jgi:uncharacterized protein YjbK